MAEIMPFRGLRYNGDKFKDIGPLTAPPYDVISPALQDELYKRHEDNIVRIDFGKKSAADTDADNRYTRAADTLREWLETGVLVREDAPALYLYELEYATPQGEAKKMSGFICLLRLEEWDKGIVLPHEGTLKGPKADRYELYKATGASASQVFSLYSDPKKRITRALRQAVSNIAADAVVKDDDGTVHRLWAVKDGSAINVAVDVMTESKVFIADGHHRYETALAYRNDMRAKGPYTGDEAFNFVPMFLADMDEEGLTILPTHRLIKGADFKLPEIIGRAAEYFDIEEMPAGTDGRERAAFLDRIVKKGRDAHTFGLYFGGEETYYVLTLRGLEPVLDLLSCKRSDAYCKLDVTILHELIVERVLGIDGKKISEEQPVSFEKDGAKAIERVKAGEFGMCFLLNATKVREVKEVALAREIMPQKSTYFYPKLLTGLVIAELK